MFAALVKLLFVLALPAAIFFLFEQNKHKPKAEKAANAPHTPTEAPTTASVPATEQTTTSTSDGKADKTHRAAALVEAHQQQPANDTASAAPTAGPSRGPKILIAYASNSQNALTLSHKLFNAVNNQLLEQKQRMSVSDSPADATNVVVPTIKILELREEDSHACNVDTLLNTHTQSDSFYSLVVFVVSTFTDGTAPPRSQNFEKVLKDCYEDHRVPRDALGQKRFAIFGLGDIAYGEKHFNAFAKNLVQYCRGLGAPHFVVPPVYATEAKVSSLFQIFSQTLLKWLTRAEFLADGTVRVQKKATAAKAAKAAAAAAAAPKTCCTDDGECACHDGSGEENGDGTAKGAAALSDDDDDDDDDKAESGMDEIEDLIDDIETNEDDHAKAGGPAGGPRELLNPRLRKNLEKQGYNLIGSHSGVKLCRWTKAMLRGRGGCYKHTFYNINSSQCMELTPSLACANKCIFCWRHHTNPVSTQFRWKVDDPDVIVDGGIERHVKMIKQMRGVPGVSEENLQKAFTVRHCALSLVGEPIMYPRINEFLHLLHTRSAAPISSFMVTNAQFPEQLRMLRPVTQLYLSIDAPTPDELKRIDRPLFEDYWERCLSCVEVLRKKRNTRTVFRLTLVNEMNDANIASYADLVEQGWPDFIEVKGVTFCGTSHTNTINMKTNVPRHDEVIDFCARLCQEIARRKPNYVTETMNAAAAESEAAEERSEDTDMVIIPAEERNRPYHIACEHEHSCCVLVALDKFYFNKRWNTWIDYPKFFELAAKYEEVNGLPPVMDDVNEKLAAATNGAVLQQNPGYGHLGSAANTVEEEEQFSFTSLDYCAPTPSWAVYRSVERGFDPDQTRVVGKKARPTAPREQN